MIPVKLERDYSPKGWLGLILGAHPHPHAASYDFCCLECLC
jgi:hypothetical protein